MERAEAINLIRASFQTVLDAFSPDATIDASNLTDFSELDSLGLVMFVTDLDQRLRKYAPRDIGLAEALVLPHEQNPYRSVAALADHILEHVGPRAASR